MTAGWHEGGVAGPRRRDYLEAMVVGVFVALALDCLLLFCVPELPRISLVNWAEAAPVGTRAVIGAVVVALVLTVPCTLLLVPTALPFHVMVQRHFGGSLLGHALIAAPSTLGAYYVTYFLDGHTLATMPWSSAFIHMPGGMIGGAVVGLSLRRAVERAGDGPPTLPPSLRPRNALGW